ncbi:RNA-directed DNA polymerase [Halobacteriovorax sp. GFR7]|uniref:RNA-directed DNA polymerase n=1 Tax=unclassified Halobacteriovorax TaxID=2639665 RepID=UPI003D9953E0
MLENIFTEERIAKAINLVNLQEKSGANAFNNIEYLIYKSNKDKPDARFIFDKYVKHSNFYNHHEYLKGKNYNVAKGLNGTRVFHFLEKESLILYTALGIYIQELITPTFENFKRDIDFNNRVHTYYGADINIQNIQKSTVTYKDDYSDFLKRLKESAIKIFGEGNNFHIIKMDIKDFYYSIDHRELLKTIKEYTTEEVLLTKDHSDAIEDEISDYLYLLMSTSKGLPVSNQNITSSYIANTFLYKLDDYIYKLLHQSKNTNNWRYIRYVDDIYIFIENHAFEVSDLNSLVADVSFYIANHLGLQMNSKKSSITNISSSDDIDMFLDNASIVSNGQGDFALQFHEINDHNEVIQESKKIIKNLMFENIKELNTTQTSILNMLFIEKLKEKLKSEDYYKTLKSCSDWDYPERDLNYRNILIAPKQILNFFNFDKDFIDDLNQFIIKSFERNFKDHSIYHFVEYLLINNLLDENISETLSRSQESTSYIKLLKRSITKINNDTSQILIPPSYLFKEIPSLPLQCKQLALAERKGDISRCLNHLYNILIEFAKYKYQIENQNNYNISLLINNLGKESLSIKDIRMLRDIAYLRCNNGISHPGHMKTNKDIYIDFKIFVHNFLNNTH